MTMDYCSLLLTARGHLLMFIALAQILWMVDGTPPRLSSSVDPSDHHDLFLPVASTTALMCQPIFSGGSSQAVWYKDGVKIASVSSGANALLPNRTFMSDKPIPEVGFLIVSDVRRDDEGAYQCIDENAKVNGDKYNLKVAFVSTIPIEGHISMEPHRVTFGDIVSLHCPVPHANPSPAVSWHLNGSPLLHVVPESTAFSNGTLHIPRFTLSHLGLYECTFANFAGKTHTRMFIDAKDIAVQRHSNESSQSITPRCTYFFRACVLWFLIGCLATSCVVLSYLLCALCCIRPSRRTTLRPSSLFRSHPSLGPGFRKPIVPLPDFYVPPTQPLAA